MISINFCLWYMKSLGVASYFRLVHDYNLYYELFYITLLYLHCPYVV